jgi:hypothetical protein
MWKEGGILWVNVEFLIILMEMKTSTLFTNIYKFSEIQFTFFLK